MTQQADVQPPGLGKVRSLPMTRYNIVDSEPGKGGTRKWFQSKSSDTDAPPAKKKRSFTSRAKEVRMDKRMM